MKELSTEQKARAYNEAIERAKEYHNADIDNTMDVKARGIMEYLFPELVDSEDERIKKSLIDYFSRFKSSDMWNESFSFDDVVSWIEKQGEQKPADKIQLGKEYKCIASPRYSTFMIGKIYKPEDKFLCSLMNFCYDCFEPIEDGEQKPADKVEPKFHEGDWVVWDNKVSCHVDNIYQGKESLMYTITDTNNMTRSHSVKGFDNNAHLWSIEDAKDGDVLVCGDFGYTSLMLFESFSNGRISLHCWYNSQTNNFHINTDVALRKDAIIHPATKEQRDLLFRKMKEAGYEWDAEKKELSKYICFTKTMTSEKVSPAWSKEDDIYIENIILAVEKQYPTAAKDIVNWLKSLKNRINNFYA